jgi:two-component system, cell cycle response regulator
MTNTAGLVVVADDSAVARAVVRDQLEAEGYRVVEADNGRVAVAACREVHPDVVLLDIEMPELDGYAVLAALKQDDLTSTVPVVFLTGQTTTADVVEGLRLGAHDYLRKPFEPAELTARVSAAMRTKRLQDQLRARNEELQSMLRTDLLTGLPNRRHLDEYLRMLSSASRRQRHPLSALMIDVDHFKRINDQHGHSAGDAVLVAVAKRIGASLRTEDVAGRWGGEEFLVLLPATDLDGAWVLGDRVRQAVADEPVDLGDGTDTIVTISVGCAVGQGDDVADQLRRADAALYEAKSLGRNRTVADTSVVS